MKKYELTEEKQNWFGRTLYRIRALKDFETASGLTVKAGDLGGFIEKESNLSQNGDAWVFDNAKVYDSARVCDNAKVCGDAWVYGNAKVCGDAEVCGNAEIRKTSHIITIGPIGSRGAFTTFYRDKDNSIFVRCGCFNGSVDEFLEEVKEKHGENKHAKAYFSAVETAKKQIDLSEENKDV